LIETIGASAYSAAIFQASGLESSAISGSPTGSACLASQSVRMSSLR